METPSIETGFEAAVIGMAGRFPGAGNIEEFWNHLQEGIESISFFNDRELGASGHNPEFFNNNEDYVRCKGIIEGSEYFDANFFEYSPEEAEQMDPQVRMFHESIWTALEDAGYDPYTYDGLIGLYAGATDNIHWQSMVTFSDFSSVSESFSLGNLSNKDFISTQISYKLNLKGPSTTIANACSTSLVSAHLAYHGLLNGECDMALTGGVSITIPIKTGYVYQEGMAFSQDGHNRSFAQHSSGTVFSNGVGVVVLKRYKDAMADHDHIYAVIKGSAINNDGNRKVGFSAPSVEGQAEVIRGALEMAEVEPESISYVETHGTGTILGDPIEIRALKRGFNTKKKNFCALGSVKSNIGHLDAAAGVAGLIKTILVLTHRSIPPSLHFESSNPQIDFKDSPFYVNTKLTGWKPNHYPMRAGISSFGIGGTNVHFILEEACEGTGGLAPLAGEAVPDQASDSRQYQLILLSAKTETALDKMTKNLAGYFNKNLLNHGNHHHVNPGQTLVDAAYTLQTGRRALNYRRILVCANVNEAIAALETPGQQVQGKIQTRTFLAKERRPYVVFMFSGLGSQYVNMGWDLYRTEPVFRQHMDRCFDLAAFLAGPVKDIIYPGNNHSFSSSPEERKKDDKINRIFYSGLIKFSFDFSMANLLMKWGIAPDVMIGHSFGEYVAACLSGVFSLEDALKLVKARGEVLEQMPEGAMLSIPLSEEEITPYLQESDELSFAAVNSPFNCIVSGPPGAIDALDKKLLEKECECIRLNVPRGGHSRMMDPYLAGFKEKVSSITLHPPQIPYVSSVTGKLITAGQATDPGYWTRHMRETVRFADGISQFIKKSNVIFIQVGVGRGLTLYVDQHPGKTLDHLTVNLLRSHKEDISDVFYLLDKIGDLWLWGKEIDWSGFHAGEKPGRIALPTYPFEGQRYWRYIDELQKNKNQPQGTGPIRLKKNKEIAQWFYIPTWERSVIQSAVFTTANTSDAPGQFSQACWLVFMDNRGIGSQLVKKLNTGGRRQDLHIIRVHPGHEFKKIKDHEFMINREQENHYNMLFDQLQQMDKIPGKIVHLWGLIGNRERELDPALIKDDLELGFYSLLHLAKWMGKRGITHEVQVDVVTDSMQEMNGEEQLCPGKSLVLGPVKVIPQEYSNVICRSIDVTLPEPGSSQEDILIKQLLTELTGKPADTVIAYRGNYRWVQSFKPLNLDEALEKKVPLREKGVYLISGGLGGIGLILAEYLASSVGARLILTGRSPFPARKEWEKYLGTHEENDSISRKIRKLQQIEAMGSDLMVCSADAAQINSMQDVISRAEKEFGPINGVIHSAGIVGNNTIRAIEKIGKTECETQFLPKVYGLLVLEALFKDKPLDFCLLMSSLAAILGGLGHVAYSAANIFMDAFVHRLNRGSSTPWISVNWELWQSQEDQKQVQTTSIGATLFELAVTPEEGIKSFKRILGWGKSGQVLHSSGELQTRIEKWIKLKALRRYDYEDEKEDEVNESRLTKMQLKPRPNLSTPYKQPTSELEKRIASTWQELFGFERVGVLDDFFEMGGDSLKAMIISSRIQKKLKVRLPLTEFFRRSTIKNIAGYVEEKKKENKKEEVSISIKTAEKKEYYPLSSAQGRLYVLWQMDKKSIGYNETIITELGGVLAKDRLEQTFNKLIARHESLRTCFEMIEIKPVQRIHKKIEFDVEYYDLSKKGMASPTYYCIGSGKNHREEKVCQKNKVSEGINKKAGRQKNREASIIKNFVRGFDLSRAPLLRVGVIKIETERCLLMVDMPHIITDGVSRNILVAEYMALYSGQELPPLKIQYKDYAQWQNSGIGKQREKKQMEFWLRQFHEEIPVLNLPTDYKRPSTISFEGNALEFAIDKENTSGLKKLAVKEDVTIYILCLAIYNVLLVKLSGQEDIVVGTVIAGRNHQDLENVMGMFVNTLALRNFPVGEKTFVEFLEELKTRTLLAFENQDYQFEKLVERVVSHRDPARNPLFDVELTFQNIYTMGKNEAREINIPGLQLKSYNYSHRTSKFDMTCHGYDTGQHIALSIEYSSKIFKKETIQRFINYFRRIVIAVLKGPTQKISGIQILAEKEKKEVLVDFNASRKPYPGNKTIHELIEEQVKRTPDQIALVGSWQLAVGKDKGGVGTRFIASDPGKQNMCLTYKELNQQSNRLAHSLRQKGLQADTVVGIMAGACWQVIVGIFAILKAGGAYLPIDPDYPEERIQYMLEDGGAKILVTTPGLSEKSKKLLIVNCQLLMVNEKPPNCRRINNYQLTINNLQLKGNNLAYIIYTSGSTGSPKGVMVEHQNLVNYACWAARNYVNKEKVNFPLYTSISFDLTVTSIFTPLITGNAIVVYREKEKEKGLVIEKILEEDRVGVVKLTPSHLRFINQRPIKKLPVNIRRFIVGGEKLEPQLAADIHEKFKGKIAIYNEYGPTETTVGCMIYKFDPQDRRGDSVSLGVPADNVQIYILDKYQMPVSVGVIGEIFISGDGVARGYCQGPELTVECFLSNPFIKNKRLYRTGDLARWLADGNIEFLGRIDNQVKIRGFRIELGEIENRLLQRTDIKEAVVLVKNDDHGNKYLCAYIVSVNPIEISVLKEYLSGYLPGYMIPSFFVPLAKIPLTPNGKVDRRSLPKPEESHLYLKKVHVAPTSRVEKIIANAWKEVLNQEKIGVHDKFFDIGGNSLNIVQVNAKLKQALGKELPLIILFRYTTIRSLAQFIGQQKAETKIDVHRTNRKETLKKGKSYQQQRYEKRKTRRKRTDSPTEQRSRRNR